MSYRPVKCYKFDSLTPQQKFEIVASDPTIRVVAEEFSVTENRTKPLSTDAVGLLLLGVASAIFHGDAAAERELETNWAFYKPLFEAAGATVSDTPLKMGVFRYWRDQMLTTTELQETNDRLRATLRELAVGQARDIGLLDSHEWEPTNPGGWFEVPRERVLMADGTWFKPLAGIDRKAKHRSGRTTRSNNGIPKESVDARSNNKGTGYLHVVLAARGPKSNQQIMFDVVHSPSGAEMEEVIDSLEQLRDVTGRMDAGFVYDGAMRGQHLRRIRTQLGVMALAQRHGSDGTKYRETLGTTVPRSKQHVFAHDFDCGDGQICRHQLRLTNGVVFNVEPNHIDQLTHVSVCEQLDLQRTDAGNAWFWVSTYRVPCDTHGEHTLTINLDEPVKNTAEKLPAIAQSEPAFRRIYGYRNAAESLMNYLKFVVLGSGRAQSLTNERHELDLRFATLITNSLAWAQHSGRYINKSLKKCGHERRERCGCSGPRQQKPRPSTKRNDQERRRVELRQR